MTMISVFAMFSLFMISSNFCFLNCVSEKHFLQMLTEENMQRNNMYESYSGMAEGDSKNIHEKRRQFFSGADSHSRKKRGLNLHSYLSTSIGDLRSAFMFSMGSNRGGRNGEAMSFGNNPDMKNGMMSTTSNENPMNGMRMHGSTSTSGNEKMPLPIGTGSDFNSKMGSFPPTEGTPMNNGNIFRDGMGIPMENNRGYELGSGMPASNHEIPIGTGFNSNVGNGMPISVNTGWNSSANVGNSSGASMQRGFGAEVNNNMKLSGGNDTATRHEVIMP